MVAEEFEIARFAATLVAVEYEEEEAVTDLDTTPRSLRPSEKANGVHGGSGFTGA